jgi:hypothetical protein
MTGPALVLPRKCPGQLGWRLSMMGTGSAVFEGLDIERPHGKEGIQKAQQS